jgi:hypothetical protein
LVGDEGGPDWRAAEVAFGDGGVEAQTAGFRVAVDGEGVAVTVVENLAV